MDSLQSPSMAIYDKTTIHQKLNYINPKKYTSQQTQHTSRKLQEDECMSCV